MDLQDNSLTSLGVLSKAVNLMKLHLDNNRITEIEDSLKGLHNLTDLSLADNKIKEIGEAFLGCSKMHRLNLSGNNLSSAGGVENCNQLVYVDISRNSAADLEVWLRNARAYRQHPNCKLEIVRKFLQVTIKAVLILLRFRKDNSYVFRSLHTTPTY